MSLRGLSLILGWAVVSLVFAETALAQDRSDAPADTSTQDSTVVDTSAGAPEARPPTDRPDQAAPPRDGDAPRQTSRPPDSTAGPPRPGSNRPGGAQQNSEAVTFSARDSMVIRTDEAEEDYGTLHGEAEMSYKSATLQAQTIEMDFQSSTLRATGPPTDTAQAGRPRFQRSSGQGSDQSGSPGQRSGAGQGGQSFTGDVLSYNLETERGRVVAARTEQQDGYVQGNAVKMFEDSTLFVQDGTYTTCNCPPGVTPSYSLRSGQMKMQDRWVYTGPIQLFLFNVPTPLWLPFGFLPNPNIQGRRSGPLPPEYGEDRRGFYLKNWGWYFAMNDYMDLTIRAGIWSQGSYEIRPRFRYRKRYEYNGNLQFTYRREQVGEEIDPNFQNRHQGELRWNHSQDLSPTASLDGDIDLATSSDFARRNSDDYDDAVRQDVSSSINYRKRWPNGGRQFNVSASQKQQFGSGNVNVTLPNLGFSQNSFKPFKREQAVGEERWYEKVTTSYQLDVTNNYDFRPRDPSELRENGTPADSALADSVERANVSWYEALADRQKYRLATGDDELYDFEATHSIPLNMSFRLDRYNLTLSPNLQYSSDWYGNTVRRTAQRDTTGGLGEVVERTEPGFYARHNFNSSFSMSSEAYGTFPVGVGPFQGLRHRLSPSLSMNYQPNFNAPFWGRTRVLRFPDGTPVVEDSSTGDVARYDILNGSRVNRSTQQWSLNFSLGNVFETKRVETDTTGDRTEETVTLLNLDLSGLSYNFAADSFRVGNNISLNARTRIEPFNISMQSGFSPYALRSISRNGQTTYRRKDRLMVAESPLTPVRLTNFRFSMSADFSSDDGGSMSAGRQSRRGGRSRGGPPSSQNRGAGPSSNQRGPSAEGQSGSAPRNGGQMNRPSELSSLNLPWSLNFNFNYRLQKQQKDVTNRNATLSVDFSLNITQLWRVQGNTGYDFMQNELSTTRISINRNLGCWDMSFTWVPFGEYQKYGFRLQVSSGQLSQLLQLQIPNQGGEGRLGGFGDRLQGAAQGAAGLQGSGGGGRFGGGGY